jgi:hypothetical protein
MTSSSYDYLPITAVELERPRSKGSDVSGNPLVPLSAEGGEPLRCCLRPALEGESLLLFGYEPALPGSGSPYREVGAVLTHAEACGGPGQSGYPQAWLGRPQVLRAYDERGWIHDASRSHDGSDPEAVIGEMFADPTVVELHSRNISWGCYMFRVLRA